MIYCQLLNRMDHCNYVSLLIFTVTTRMCQPRKVCRKYIWCSAMLVENGFRKQTQEGSNKTHLPGECRWLHGNWGGRGAGCPARKEQELPCPGAGRLSLPWASGGRGGTATPPLATPSTSHGGAADSPLAVPPAALAHPAPLAWQCSQGSKGTSLAKSCCRNETHEPSVGSALVRAGLCPW